MILIMIRQGESATTRLFTNTALPSGFLSSVWLSIHSRTWQHSRITQITFSLSLPQSLPVRSLSPPLPPPPLSQALARTHTGTCEPPPPPPIHTSRLSLAVSLPPSSSFIPLFRFGLQLFFQVPCVAQSNSRVDIK